MTKHINLLFIQYATALPTKYTLPIDTVMMEVKGPTQMLNECSNLTQSDVSCSFNLTEGGIYSVKLITMNAIGATSNEKSFNCKYDKCIISRLSIKG